MAVPHPSHCTLGLLSLCKIHQSAALPQLLGWLAIACLGLQVAKSVATSVHRRSVSRCDMHLLYSKHKYRAAGGLCDLKQDKKGFF